MADPSHDISRVLSRDGPLNIYQLSKKLGWTYGKCERHVSRMLVEHQLFSTTSVENGRMTRLVSTTPMASSNEQDSGKNIDSSDNDDHGYHDQLTDAFKHLYGVFKALKEANIDPSAGLARYCKEHGMKPSELISIFDAAMASA